MGETARRHSELLDRGGKGIGLDRLLFFSDAVFAIAITLLVIELGVTTVGANGDELSTAVIGREMLAAWPSYLAYVISFAVIGMNWSAHHRNLSLLVRYDTSVVWLNLVLLMFVAFLPYPTRTMFEGRGSSVIRSSRSTPAPWRRSGWRRSHSGSRWDERATSTPSASTTGYTGSCSCRC